MSADKTRNMLLSNAKLIADARGAKKTLEGRASLWAAPLMGQLADRLEAAEKVITVARKLTGKGWIFHDCKGPTCVLCMKLPDALADYDEEAQSS